MRWFCGQAAGGFTSVRCICLIDVDIDRYIYRYPKNSEISHGAYVACVAGVETGRGKGNLGARESVCGLAP